ncbi:hypothetical protein ENUP19_0370G0021 [Entamoeba nuttalli]|uniref:Nucleosome assembly protein, putative n=2 Tax=Entamoeba nuttalli TaxID=412467 RepID=K2GA64_ENTNP|nr:nucleosome assembly protein, putative [Entamoeba nuttalli P19]EKE39366.1 nucleosome assembly protein, putative [Entamoeba nuttalli P19]|eukprot:XP_008858298.1 nucleosome assembly protein, putative [Entamoeba nuttalli P19]
MAKVIPVGYKNYLKRVSSNVQKNIFALKQIQQKMDMEEMKTIETRFQQTQKLLALEKPITDKIVSLINGTTQADKTVDCSSIKVRPNPSKHFKGIPAFWHRIFIIENLSDESDMKCDKEILRTLKDIQLNNNLKADTEKGIVLHQRTIQFDFDENQYMKPQSVSVQLSFNSKIGSNSHDSAEVKIIQPFVWKGVNPYEKMDVNDFTFFLPFFLKDDIKEYMLWFNRIYDIKSFMGSSLLTFKERLHDLDANDNVSMDEDSYYDEEEEDDEPRKRTKDSSQDCQPKRKATDQECKHQ